MKITAQSFESVFVDDEFLDPRPSQDVWNHSPDGFAWGYGGSGPAQLALAILLKAGLPSERAVALHQAFKWAFIAPAPKGPWEQDIDVQAWAAGQQ